MLIGAPIVVFLLGTFIGLWGLTLLWRGVVGERERVCTACGSASRCACRAAREKGERRSNWIMAGVGAVCMAAGPIVYSVALGLASTSYQDAWNTAGYGASGGVMIFGATILAIGWRGDRARGRQRCPKCWYDMAGAPGLMCPECGHEVRQAKGLLKTRRRWRVIGAGAVLMAGGLAPMSVTRYREGGVMALAPTTVLIAGMKVLPRPLIFGGPWSLAGRISNDEMWEWQQVWAMERSAALVRGSDSLREAQAPWMVQLADSGFGLDETAKRRILHLGLVTVTSGDARLEADLINLGPMMYGWMFYPRHTDSVTPFKERLRTTVETSENEDIVCWALYFLAGTDDAWLMDTLLALRSDERTTVSDYADTLLMFEMSIRRTADERIVAQASQGDAEERQAAISLLASVNSAAAMRVLIRALDDEDDAVAAHAASALMFSHDDVIEAATAILEAAAKRQAVRLEMLTALKRSYALNVEHIEMLAAFFEDEDGVVATTALDLVQGIYSDLDLDPSARAEELLRVWNRPDVDLPGLEYWFDGLKE